jgi:hypothetical protein
MNLLFFNQDWFADWFRQAGHRVVTCGLTHQLDVVLESPVQNIHYVLQRMPDFKPDAIVYLDNSSPLTIMGLGDCEIPVIFYAVDTHHHLDMHRALHHFVDCTLVAQKDYIPLFDEAETDPIWLPLWASQYIKACETKEFGAVFVGTLKAHLNPDRVKFFEALTQKVPILFKSGAWQDIFPLSEIVVNQTVKGDLNFRTFEAMVSGATLLTERLKNGQEELFVPDTHFVTYERNNVEEAAEKINWLLANPKLCREIAEAGRAEVLKKHLAEHRAPILLEAIKNTPKRNQPTKYLSGMINFHILSRRLHKIDSGQMLKALLETMKLLEQGLSRGEVVTEEASFHAVSAAVEYDQHINSKAGAALISQLAEVCPDMVIFRIAKLRNFLNNGDLEHAEQLARELSEDDPKQTFLHAENVIATLLEVGQGS